MIWLALVLSTSTGMDQGAFPAYFPPRAIVLDDPNHRLGEISESFAGPFSTVLGRMREPSLWQASQNSTGTAAYRLVVLETEFDPPVAVRVEQRGDQVTLRRVTLGRFGKSSIAEDRTVALAPAAWGRLVRQVEATRFREMPTRISNRGFDGEEVLIEGVGTGGYHVVDRWSPDPGPFRDLYQTFLSLAAAAEPPASPTPPDASAPTAPPIPPPTRDQGHDPPRTPRTAWFAVATTVLLVTVVVLILRRWPDAEGQRWWGRPRGGDDSP